MDEGKGSSFVIQILKSTLKLFFILVGVLATLFLLIASIVLGKLPSDQEIRSCLTTKLYEVNLCPTSGHYTPLGQISSHLQKAVVLTEDSAFYQHDGFDFTELKKSLEKNLEKGRFVRGGSTITQQLAKNLFLTKEKTLTRKGMEALITMRLEKVLSKKEILEKYLNVVQFGKDLYGVKDASKFYFKKTPQELTVVESAFLTFLLPSPEVYSKSFHIKRLTPFAQKRLKTIISRLYEYERIGFDEYEQAQHELAYFLTGQVPAPALEAPEFESLDEESAPTDENE